MHVAGVILLFWRTPYLMRKWREIGFKLTGLGQKRQLLSFINFGDQLLCTPLYTQTVDYDRFIKSQLASRNQLKGLVWCKFGKFRGNEPLEVHRADSWLRRRCRLHIRSICLLITHGCFCSG